MSDMFSVNLSNGQLIKRYLLSILSISEKTNFHGLFPCLTQVKALGNGQVS